MSGHYQTTLTSHHHPGGAHTTSYSTHWVQDPSYVSISSGDRITMGRCFFGLWVNVRG